MNEAMGGRKPQIEGHTGVRLAVATVLCGPVAGLRLLLAGFALSYGAAFGAAFGWPLMILWGIAAHSVLFRTGHRTRKSYLIWGVVAGVVVAILVATFGLVTSNSAYLAPFAGGCLIACPVATWLFWLIRRPDRDQPTA